MDEKDFERIGQVVAQIVDSRLERIDAKLEQIDSRFDQIDGRFEQIDGRFEQIDARFEQVDGRFKQIDGRFEQIDGRFEQTEGRFEQTEGRFEQINRNMVQLKDDLTNEFHHSLGLERDSIHEDLQLLAEGQQMLSERIDRLERHFDSVTNTLVGRIDRIAVDLAGHCADTEAHHGVYRVKEPTTEFTVIEGIKGTNPGCES